jgi:hypothetical protein
LKNYKPVLSSTHYLFLQNDNHIVGCNKDSAIIKDYCIEQITDYDLPFSDLGYRVLTQAYPNYIEIPNVEELKNSLIGDYIFLTSIEIGWGNIDINEHYLFYKEIPEQDKTVLTLLNIDYERTF